MSASRRFDCKEVAGLLVFYTCAETSEQENRQIEAHLAACAGCAAQLNEERSLHESLVTAMQASERFDADGILLSQCRSELAEALDELSAPPLNEPRRPLGWFRRWMVLRPVLSGSFLVLCGVALGTQMVPWLSERFNSNRNMPTVQVSPRGKFSDEQLAKMAVAGISFMPASDNAPGGLQLQMKTEEPMVLSGSVDDPDVRRVLTYVVEKGDQTDPGVRLDCMEALRTRTADEDVRTALLNAARRDQNPAVRMKALESLRDASMDDAMREALIDALQHDANTGVRVEAVNILVRSLEASGISSSETPEAVVVQAPSAERTLDPSLEQVVRTLQELQRKDPNRYVRLRSAAALRQIGPREVQ